MSTYYTINVTNNSDSGQGFFFFQAPISSTVGAAQSHSLFQANLPAYASSGSVLTFCVSQQYYACAQTELPTAATNIPFNGITSSQPIELALPAGPSDNNSTNLSVNPLGLSPAYPQAGVMPGAFRIVTPAYDAETNGIINIGLAVKFPRDGSIAISSLLEAAPNLTVDCQPNLQFYVQIGAFQQGAWLNFPIAAEGAAVCDASTGESTFNVTYNLDRTWTVTAQ
ncbi:hypothetical protein [Pseudomonas sp. Marseille-P9899]|uniref:hypothetical protein n=1 Tax=Pseudomonas sp. Marseille-P9899 TaxID=2730401 RepID=UPI00158C2161|nr:hypothetical protein [Pseudomonas sp. Marseille-P9899]